MSDSFQFPLDALVRSVGVNRSSPHAFLLGAGASITSGIPPAASCIWKWKLAIFLTNNPGLETQFTELSLPSVRLKIQNWLNRQVEYPASDAPDEYGFYIQKCFPIAEDRRAFFQEAIRNAKPHIGYKLLVKLAEEEIVTSVWTPNFDGLAAKAAAGSDIVAIEVGIDCSERLIRRRNRGELLCVSLHGDYRYDRLKNTGEELRLQDEKLRSALVEEVRDTQLIVSGYSGRDDSLMEALEAGYSRAGTGNLYWCGMGNDDLTPRVRHLISKAREAGRGAYYVPSVGFDDLLLRIALHSLDAGKSGAARALLQEQERSTSADAVAFTLPKLPACGIVKSNAFVMSPPAEIYEFSLKSWPKHDPWEYFRARTDGKPCVAAPFKGKGYALGTIEDIRACFDGNIVGSVERVPINGTDLSYEDGAINSVIRRALLRAFAMGAGLDHDGVRLAWKKEPREQRNFEGQVCAIYDAVLVYLRRFAGNQHLVLKPTVRIQGAKGREVPEELKRKLKMSVLGWQHNAEFNRAIEDWRKVLSGRYEFPPLSGSPFRFQLQRIPVLAEVMSRERRARIQISEKYRPYLKQLALELSEPKLVYSNRSGDGRVSDAHPVRGIVRNRPFDFPLTLRQLAVNVRLGVVCPAREASRLSAYLHGLATRLNPGRFEADYLPPYPGFEGAFGVPLDLPAPDNSSWVTCPEIDDTLSDRAGALELARHITRCIEGLRASASPNVIVIFVPSRWSRWRGFEDEAESFDLHNFVKAFCVPQGIATQFIEEDTLLNLLQCRIRWWLSLALYVKSMRTPWVLESLNSDSAFVGFGMSLNRRARAGSRVILGCSHLYSAQGQGLQFRLSKIENPIIRRRNAFMSFDDARRVGETIRQLFWESRFSLPGRVVIHKLTPFLDEEQRGLRAGLSGVAEIELLEIYVDEALRYLSSVPRRDGNFDQDKFPMKRGTVLQMDSNAALLWVHGTSDVVDEGRKYYQGKRRIPAPLVIRRHAGRSDLATVGEEILGLSKMNWNNFDLYTKLPATIESSQQIARIGALLERFGSYSYDYRLFM